MGRSLFSDTYNFFKMLHFYFNGKYNFPKRFLKNKNIHNMCNFIHEISIFTLNVSVDVHNLCVKLNMFKT